MSVILPSEASGASRPWGPDQDRLHRHLLRHPSLLPGGARLLLAVSGGQDSMALTALLRDLSALHGWELSLWHGDHGWRAESAVQGQALALWAAGQGLPLHLERADPVPTSEAAARQWRYGCLRRQAAGLGSRHVLTGHTASDRAETLLLHLARGSHRRGLASMRASRPLAGDCWLVRPLLLFSRQDTERICRTRALPVWIDTSNADLRYSRNRLRAEVLPVLEDLHPGATVRIAATAERLAEDEDQVDELVSMALKALSAPPGASVSASDGSGEMGLSLACRGLLALHPANQRRILQLWLRVHKAPTLDNDNLERLIARLRMKRGPGRQDLAHGWHLSWNGCSLTLSRPVPCPSDHGEFHHRR
jgi:tRNA(Ile)-lysidine synthase